MGNPVVDMFASRLNHHLPQRITWRPDPFSQGTDAMHHDWSQDYLYAFPLLLPYEQNFAERRARKISKHVVDNNDMPHSALVSIPSSNVNRNTSYPPKDSNLLKDPLAKEHPLITKKPVRLTAWKTSGRDYLCQEFWEQLPVLLLTQGEVHLQETINQPGESGLAGVKGNKLVQFCVLQL